MTRSHQSQGLTKEERLQVAKTSGRLGRILHCRGALIKQLQAYDSLVASRPYTKRLIGLLVEQLKTEPFIEEPWG